MSFNAAAFSGDGKLLVTGSNALRLWDVATGKELRAWHETIDGVRAVALSQDGTILMTTPAGRDRSVRLWDTGTGEQLHEFPAHEHTVACLSPSGDRLAIIGERPEVTVWDTESGERIARFRLARGGREWAAFHPDGGSIFVGGISDPGGLRRYDAATGENLGVVVDQSDVRGVGFTGDFTVVATMTYADPVVRLWDVASGELKGEITGGDNELGAIALSPDGKVLATQAQGPAAPFVLWKAPD
jgi:WD40 repeat protein